MSILRRFLLLGPILGIACGDSAPLSVPLPPPAPGILSILISPTGETIAAGDSILFHATTNIPGTTGFVWTVNSPSLAAVTARGWVRALNPGLVMVRACAEPTLSICGVASLTIR